MEKRLECTEGAAAKFWQIKVEGSKTHVSYGKIGTKGQSQVKDHGSAAAAMAFAEKQIKEKEGKGYSEASTGGTKREPPAAAEPTRTDRSAAKGGSSKRAKKAKEHEEKVATPRIPAQLWRVRYSDTPTSIYGLYATDTAVYAGDDQGRVVELSLDGNVVRIFKLPAGVKCIVGDGPFLYAGCNNASLYELSSGEARLVCKLEEFAAVLWIDIRHGMLAASDSTGRVALINTEGETVWSKKDALGMSGWMVRIDDSGVYHGTSDGVVKYDYSGNIVWEQREKAFATEINFGCQDKNYVYAACRKGICKIDKATGKLERVFPTAEHLSSCAVSPDGAKVIPSVPFACFDGTSGAQLWGPSPPYHSYSLHGQTHYASMFYHGTRVYGDEVVCFELEADGGKSGEVKNSSASSTVKEIKPMETVETTTDTSKGVLCECIKEGSKLRIRVTHAGYNSSWNVQFPQLIREEGAKYVVDQVLESGRGGFYRVLGAIKKVK